MATLYGGGTMFSSISSASDLYELPELAGYPKGNNAVAGRTPVSKALVGGEVTAVGAFFGDSVLTNVVSTTYTSLSAKNQNGNVYDGAVYPIQEPLLGCQINAAQYLSGCFYSEHGDKLIAGGYCARHIGFPFGVGGTVLADYAVGGQVNGRIAAAYRRMRDMGLPPTYWHITLGANDHTTTLASAMASMVSIIASIRAVSAANIFVAKHSLFSLVTYPNVQAAQLSVLDANNKVYDGGNFDSLTTSGYYWDDTHPNATGRAAMATLSSAAVMAH